MSVKLIILLCLTVALDAGAHELRDVARGLAASVEDLAGTVAVNGLPFAVARAVGPSVPTVAERLVGRWRDESGKDSVRLIECCGWRFASRLLKGRSEVIQWRTTVAGSELYLSTVDIGPAFRISPASFPLLSDCQWTTPVHGRVAGRDFIQVSARCEREMDSVVELSIRRLAADGWRWRRISAGTVQAERGSVQAQLVAAPRLSAMNEKRAARSTLVVVETRPAGETPP